jgi:hypothetical protein
VSQPTFNVNITQLKKRAKELKRAVSTGDPEAIARAARYHQGGKLTLREAQHVIAREEGYESWHSLIEVVGEQMVDERDLHRWFAVQLNNQTWSALDAGTPDADSRPHRREQLLYGAIASVYHWMTVGTPIHQARGEHLVARTALRVGRPELALHHARRCLELVEAHPDLAEDWDQAFAYEAMARALAAAGDQAEAEQAFAEAARRGASIADETDRTIFLTEFERGEWFGLGRGPATD